jgi:hypothetical protein
MSIQSKQVVLPEKPIIIAGEVEVEDKVRVLC